MENNTSLEAGPLSVACLRTLQLSQINGLGVKAFHRLKAHFGCVEIILNTPYETLLEAGLKPVLAEQVVEINNSLVLSDSAYHERLLSWLDNKQNRVLCLEDDDYPQALKEIFCPPPILYVKGNLNAFNREALAVIGSRKPSPSGQKHAYRFAEHLAAAGLCVVSGLAIGIDTQAHRGALNGEGVTCAVLGSGLESVYPKQNSRLAEEIVESGVLVSELGLDVAALPANFPRRNRIIAGLTQGVLVVEAGLSSGSLITAEFAVEQNRDVYVLPGSIDNPLAKGGHKLIKEGAMLVDSPEDILFSFNESYRPNDSLVTHQSTFGNSKNKKELKSQLPTSHSQVAKQASDKEKHTLAQLSADEQKVISVLADQPTSFDDLVHCLGMDVSALTNSLVILEIKGLVLSGAGGYQRR